MHWSGNPGGNSFDRLCLLPHRPGLTTIRVTLNVLLVAGFHRFGWLWMAGRDAVWSVVSTAGQPRSGTHRRSDVVVG